MRRLEQYDILEMLKTLADESRLGLLRLLNQNEQSVGGLAQQLNLGEPTVSYHLARLRETGFVSLRMAGNQRFYRLNEGGLARFKQLVMEIELAPPQPEQGISDDTWIDRLGWSAADQQVLHTCTQNGQLIHIPAQRKKMLVILRWLATLFEADRLYSEADVNEVLKQVYAEDYVSLRRDLVDVGSLRRERSGSHYWLAESK